MAIGIIRKALRKATKPKSKSQQLNERIKKAQRTKGIKGAKEEFKARDEKKAFEKRRIEIEKTFQRYLIKVKFINEIFIKQIRLSWY